MSNCRCSFPDLQGWNTHSPSPLLIPGSNEAFFAHGSNEALKNRPIEQELGREELEMSDGAIEGREPGYLTANQKSS